MGLPIKTLAMADLIWALTVAPPAIQDQLHQVITRLPFRLNTLALVYWLKWLVGISIARKLNSILNEAAHNNGQYSSDRGRWHWPKEVAVVTGGCSGIGAGIVRELAKKGVKVAILDLSPLPADLKDVAAHYEKCDITDPEAVNAAAKNISTKLGTVTILVNNAGIGNDDPILEAPPAKVKKLFEVNLISHWYTVQAFVPDMVKHNKGHIVEIASLSSFINVSNFADYSAGKTALVSFSDNLRDALSTWYKAPNVHVTNVHPAYIATPLTGAGQARGDAIEKKTGKMVTVEYAAREIAKRIFAYRGTQLIVPESYNAVGYLRTLPFWAQRYLRLTQTFTPEEAAQMLAAT